MGICLLAAISSAISKLELRFFLPSASPNTFLYRLSLLIVDKELNLLGEIPKAFITISYVEICATDILLKSATPFIYGIPVSVISYSSYKNFLIYPMVNLPLLHFGGGISSLKKYVVPFQ